MLCARWAHEGLGTNIVAAILETANGRGTKERSKYIASWDDRIILYVTDPEAYTGSETATPDSKAQNDGKKALLDEIFTTLPVAYVLLDEDVDGNGTSNVRISEDTGLVETINQKTYVGVSRVEYAPYSLSQILQWQQALVHSRGVA